MKKIYILNIALIFCSMFCNSQTVIDTVQVRVEYFTTYNQTMSKSTSYDDVDYLDIGKHISKYYSHRLCIFVEKYDSLRRTTDDFWKIADFCVAMDGSKHGKDYFVYKNYPVKGMSLFADELYEFKFQYEESLPHQQWTLEEGDTIISGYRCNKAKCNFRGRNWQAWYSMDLPYDNGPWKLGGLPGLILSAKDESGAFIFQCTGIERGTGNQPIELIKLKLYEKTTFKKFQKLTEEYWNDSFNTINRLSGRAVSEKPEACKTFVARLMDYYE